MGEDQELPRTHSKRGRRGSPRDGKDVEGQGENNLDARVQVEQWKCRGARGMVEGGTCEARLNRSKGSYVPPGVEAGGGVDRTTILPWRQQGGVRRGIIRHIPGFRRPSRGQHHRHSFLRLDSGVSRAQTNRTGPGQAFAGAIQRGCREIRGLRMRNRTAMDASPQRSKGQRDGGRICKVVTESAWDATDRRCLPCLLD